MKSPMLLIGFLLVTSLLESPPSYAAGTAGPAIVIVKRAVIRKAPYGTSEELTHDTFGERVYFLDDRQLTEGSVWLHVQSAHQCGNVICTGYVAAADVVDQRRFRKVTRWNGPEVIDLQAGDYAADYYFPTKHRSQLHLKPGEEYSGPLYRYQNIFISPSTGYTFLQTDDKLCWQFDKRICATWPHSDSN